MSGTSTHTYLDINQPAEVKYGANVGNGTGLVYVGLSGNTLNFRSLKASGNTSIITQGNNVIIYSPNISGITGTFVTKSTFNTYTGKTQTTLIAHQNDINYISGKTITNGKNLGGNFGQIFLNNTGNTLNFRTLKASGSTSIVTQNNNLIIYTPLNINLSSPLFSTTGNTIQPFKYLTVNGFDNNNSFPTSTSSRLNYNGIFTVSSLYVENNISGSATGTFANNSTSGYGIQTSGWIGISSINSSFSNSGGSALYGISYGANGYGLFTTTAFNTSAHIEQAGNAGSSPVSTNVLELGRTNNTSNTISGNIINILDNPTGSTISGSLIKATLGSTVRLNLNPRVVSSGSAVAYMFDTNSLLNTSGDKLTSIRNFGTEKFSIDKLGNVNIPSGSYYMINGKAIGTGSTGTITSSLFSTISSNIAPFSTSTAGGFDNSGVNPTTTNRLNYGGNLYANSLFANTNVAGAIAISGTSSGASIASVGIYGNSPNGSGIYGISNTGIALRGVSVSGIGIEGTSTSGYAGYFYQSGGANISQDLLYLVRGNTGSFNSTGNIINIMDSPAGSGTISGSVLVATLSSNIRINLNPRVVTSGSAVAYMYDTVNNLNTSGDKLVSIRNQGTEEFSIDKSGNVNIPSGSNFMINNIPIGGGMTNPMTTAGDIIIGGASGTPTRLADVAAGSPFISGGVGVAPAYASYVFSATASQTYTFPSSSKTLAANDGTNMSLSSQTIGDLIYASSATALGRLGDVAAGSPLISGGIGVAPAYASYILTGTASKTYTFPALTKTLAANDGSNLTLPSQAIGDILYANSTTSYTRLSVGTNGTVLTLSGGVPTWGAGMTNPMTTIGDMIYAGASGTPLRLPATTNGYVLTLSSGTPNWIAPSVGMTNPMTTLGDIIVGGVSGAPTRLADVAAGSPFISGGVGVAPAYASYTLAGTASKTYTFPTLTKTLAANDATNLALPSQAIGDIIYASSTTAYTRLGVGSSGQILTVSSGKPAWESPPASGTMYGSDTPTPINTVTAPGSGDLFYNENIDGQIVNQGDVERTRYFGIVAASSVITAFNVIIGSTTVFTIPANITSSSGGGTYAIEMDMIVTTTNTAILVYTKLFYFDSNGSSNIYMKNHALTGLALSTTQYNFTVSITLSAGSASSGFAYQQAEQI